MSSLTFELEFTKLLLKMDPPSPFSLSFLNLQTVEMFPGAQHLKVWVKDLEIMQAKRQAQRNREDEALHHKASKSMIIFELQPEINNKIVMSHC